MSNYVKATNFASKDSLPVGDADKKVKGTEIDNELNAISDAIGSKADSNSSTLTGTPVAPTAAVGTNTTQIATTAFVNAEIANDAAPQSRGLTAGAGLTGGGDLSADRTFAVGAGTGITVNADDVAISTTGVTADTYGDASNIPQIAVNAQGQITSATEVAVTIPTLTYTAVNSASLSENATYDLPSNAFAISGTAYVYMGASQGGRLDIEVYSSTGGGGTLLNTILAFGGNESNGTDGGSGMSVRGSWCVLLPTNARSVKFVRGNGSRFPDTIIENVMAFTGYHS